MKRACLARIAPFFLVSLIVAGPSLAASCLQPKGGVTNANLRAEPRGEAARVGTLQAGAPLIAIMPRWYETRTSSGQVVFVSKQVSEIATCAASAGGGGGPQVAFELHAIDVGTGLSILVRGSDFALLYDAGSNDDLARGASNRAVAYLKGVSPAIPRFDAVFLSHPHRDHVELMADVFSEFEVKAVWNSGAYNDICGYRAFLKAVVTESGVQYHTALHDAGSESITLEGKRCYGVDEAATPLSIPHADRINESAVRLGQGATFRVLHADGTHHGGFNENSLVVRLDLGSRRVLFMGDAEAGGRRPPTELPAANSIEGKLLACCIDELKADVLISGHHGSKTSSRSAFLDAVGATTFIISSGPVRYGSVTLPDDEIVAQYESRGEVFRTDLDDQQCQSAPDKVGDDNDGKAGGCSNIVLTITDASLVTGEYR